MREQGKSEAGATPQPQVTPEEKFSKAIPAEFVSVVGQAAPEIVGMLLQNHPQLAAPLMTAINQLRGHGFAQQAIAAASAHPQHRPTPTGDDARAPHQSPESVGAGTPAPQAKSHVDPKLREARAVAGWNQLATAIPNESLTPEHVRMPNNLVKAIDRAWKESVAARPEKEMGGNIVKNGGSGWDVRRYGGDANGDTFDPTDRDVGWRQELVGMLHTHPYDDFKDKGVPEGFASFSEQDFDAFARSDAHLSVLRSGPFTFMLSKTKQFEQLVEATNNDESKLRALSERMRKAYDVVFEATKGKFSERVEAGILAVCREFHLVYYEGQGSELTRKSERPKA